MAIQKPRVRFAPSPTGYLHVGGARTALFNWLFARNRQGTFILRIEDTDLERNRPELVDGILSDLAWLGIEFDEGPFFQSERLELYRDAASRLLASGSAYPCFCPPSQYAGAEAREESEEAGPPGPSAARQPCPCRNLDPSERESKIRQGLSYAIRFRVPEGGTTCFHDEVFGDREVENAEIEDFVLQRSSGRPTYQLSVVVDDLAMGISHVIRGADHLSNTPKQVLLYRALGAAAPIFAHVPLILGPDRTRLSKRHGATSVGVYAEEGFLPEAFRNFLALLGWSSGDDTELLDAGEMVRRFSLPSVSRTNAVFDRAKLEWFNVQYLQKLPIDDLLPYVEQALGRAHLWREEWAGPERPWLAHAVDLIRPRTRLLGDFATWARAFFSDDFEYEEAAKAKFWKDERLPAMLEKLAAALGVAPDWNHDSCEKALRDLAAAEDVKAGLLINATRVALVGRAVAPPLFETMVVLGRERVLRRIARALPLMAAR
ncbi:MAG TPA: glutamate--tRNA ligase [Patescibacteria group bacterium]|nr:glutamate--tRNA ligase [Patescibacteria group bacterium]